MNDFVLPIILALLTLLGGTGFWGYRQSRKEAPVKKRDADIAAADKSVQMALAVATAAREDNASLREDLNKERGERQTLAGRVDGLENHIREQNRTIQTLREALRIFSTGWDELVSRWQALRQDEHPPPKPTVHIE